MTNFDVLEQIRTAAEQGSARAQFELGIALQEGDGCETDVAAAIVWFGKAAAQGHTSANINLCLLAIQNPQSCEISPSAIKNLELSAQKGDREAQLNLGLAYFHGILVEKDISRARTWYEKAAQSGSAAAQFNMGGLYFEGTDCDKDYVQALHWYSLAADQADELALLQLASMHEKGIALPRDINEAITLYTCAYRRRSIRAAVHLGIIFAKGPDIAPNIQLAYSLLRQSLDWQDDPASPPGPSYLHSAYYWLGRLTEDHATFRTPTALYWYGKGASLGCDACSKAVTRLEALSRNRRRRTHSRAKG
jgi:TPR repeat protein